MKSQYEAMAGGFVKSRPRPACVARESQWYRKTNLLTGFGKWTTEWQAMIVKIAS